MNLLGLLTGIRMRGYLQKQKWLKDNCVTNAHPSMGDSSQNLANPGHTAQPAGSAAGWRVSFLVGLNLFQAVLAGFCFFQTAGLVSSSSLQLSSSENLCNSGSSLWEGLSAFLSYSGREEPSESAHFQGLPEAILNCLPSCLSSFLQDGMF